MDTNIGVVLVSALIVLASISGAVVGLVVLYRQNKAKSERTQAMFGVGPGGPAYGQGGFGPGVASAGPGQGQGGFGPGAASSGSAPAQAAVLGKRTYAWPDRTGYYVTFQVSGQSPAEVEVSPEWYAYLNAGDQGALSLQGGQFAGFARVG